MFGTISILGSIISAVIPAVQKIFGTISDEKLKELEIQLQRELDNTEIIKKVVELDQAQSAVNAAEASNPNLYVSGWRPTIGWVCAISLGLYYVPSMVIGCTAWIHDMYIAGHFLEFPLHSTITDLITLSCNLLGMSTLRTVEKLRLK